MFYIHGRPVWMVHTLYTILTGYSFDNALLWLWALPTPDGIFKGKNTFYLPLWELWNFGHSISYFKLSNIVKVYESNYKLDIALIPMYWSKESLKSWLDFVRRPICKVFVIDSFFGGTIYHSTFMLEACSTTRSRKSNIIKNKAFLGHMGGSFLWQLKALCYTLRISIQL